MKAWSLFYPSVLPELPNVPFPMLDHWLRESAIEFCERTKAVVSTLDLVSAVANQMGYAVPLALNTDLVEIQDVWFSGEPLTPAGRRFLERTYSDWTTETGTPEHYTQDDMATVLLVPAPAAAATGAIKIRAAIKPGSAATGVDDGLFSTYRAALCAGTKAKLMLMADKPWSNPDRGAFYTGVFEGAIASATPIVAAGHTRERPRFSGSFC